jgi:hypothetical protein
MAKVYRYGGSGNDTGAPIATQALNNLLMQGFANK